MFKKAKQNKTKNFKVNFFETVATKNIIVIVKIANRLLSGNH